MTKERLRYIDWLEAIALFCMMTLHYKAFAGGGAFQNIYFQAAYCIAVPVFYMANGVLMFSRPLNLKKHLRKTGMLFVMTTAWKVIYLLATYAVSDTVTWSLSGIWYYFCGSNLTGPYVPAEHFWFMYLLIVIYLLYPLFRAVWEDRKTYYFYLLLIFIGICGFTELDFFSGIFLNGKITTESLSNWMYPLKGASYLLYFLMGPVLHERFFGKPCTKKTRLALLGIACAAVLLLTWQYHLENGVLGGEYLGVSDGYLHLETPFLSGALFALAATISWKDTKLYRIAEMISLRTMGVYAAHMFIAYHLTGWLEDKIPFRGLIVHFIRTLGILVIALALTELLSCIPVVRDILGLSQYKSRKKKPAAPEENQ